VIEQSYGYPLSMESTLDSPLVSPAKARQAAIQAKDWAYINSWLSRKYSPNNVPTFERNEDTLKTLLAIAAANDAADEEATLLHRAREEVVRAYHVREEAEDARKREVLDDLEAHLDDRGEVCLTDLAETAVTLGTLSTETTDLGRSILELTREEFDATEQVRKVQALQNYLDKELESLQHELEELKTHRAYEMAPTLSAQTAEWNRSIKLLAAKVNEYRDRTITLKRNVNDKGPTIGELAVEEENVLRSKDKLKMLESRIKAFHDLPPEVEDAKAEYKRLEQELRQLTQQRDRLFESAVAK
jgi:HAUS augmin-like complex subunit 1